MGRRVRGVKKKEYKGRKFMEHKAWKSQEWVKCPGELGEWEEEWKGRQGEVLNLDEPKPMV